MKRLGFDRLEIVVFICGAALMILELLGSRLLAPYLGTSIYVWASLIGIILGALSLGYWLGGRLADRHPQYSYLSGIILISALYIGLTPVFKDAILRMSLRGGIRIGSIISASFLFIAPSVLLGMVSPYALRLKIRKLKSSGNTAGTLYALSTLGSISGTFLAGFWLIPKFQLTDTLFGLGIVLVLTAFLAYPKKALPSIAVLIFFLILVPTFKMQQIFSRFQVDKDTPYSHIQIYDTQNDNKRPMRVLRTNIEFDSAMYLDNPNDLVFKYTKFYRLGDFFNPQLKRALMIGGGAYSVPKDFLLRHPKGKIDVVEIDPEITKLARKYFNLKKSDRLKIFTEDGRTFLNGGGEKYDAVYNDAFNSTYSIPYQLTTREAIQEMYNALNKNGVLIVNIISALKGQKSAFFLSELKTIKSVFPKVYIFPVYTKNKSVVQNIMVAALKDNNFNFEEEKEKIPDSQTLGYLKHFLSEKLTFPKHTPILTDNYAPVEYLVGKML